MPDIDKLIQLCRLIRYYVLISTSAAGSGHPTSCLSSVELITALFFGGFFHYNLDQPKQINNDQIIFSKGHAAPLLYAIYAAAGQLTKNELQSLRQFNSPLEGHPSLNFVHTVAATGSLGQGLGVGLGLTLADKQDRINRKIFVLLGDGEMAEGANWESMQLASYYQTNNLIGIVDFNGLGQTGPTINQNIYNLAYKCRSFGWQTLIIDGHNLNEIIFAYTQACQATKTSQPVIIIAKTIKGKGINFLENQPNWHGKALNQNQLGEAIKQLGKINFDQKGKINPPNSNITSSNLFDDLNQIIDFNQNLNSTNDQIQSNQLSTREAFGQALVNLGQDYPNLIVLDADVGNSTYTNLFGQKFPNRFYQMFIAEQNMLATALGLSLAGKIPLVSSFAAFLTRAFDQIRMSAYNHANIKIVGSHAGVDVGQDGFSQMGLEDIAMMRSVLNSVILYPSDNISTKKLTQLMLQTQGMVYLRLTRSTTPTIYKTQTEFQVGGSQTLMSSNFDQFTLISAGISLFECLAAAQELQSIKINIRVIDLYSIKPIDQTTLIKAAQETKAIITVEDHYLAGGIGEAVKSALGQHPIPIYSLAVTKMPKSGTSKQLFDFEQINKSAILKLINEIRQQ